MTIHVSRQFEKQYRKLPDTIKQQAQVKEALFRNDPYHPMLRTHKLQGKEKEAWAFWINYSYRIKFETVEKVFCYVVMYSLFPV